MISHSKKENIIMFEIAFIMTLGIMVMFAFGLLFAYSVKRLIDDINVMNVIFGIVAIFLFIFSWLVLIFGAASLL
ncbi:hypothetical protein VPHF86_0082 [Vibrio phage F86]